MIRYRDYFIIFVVAAAVTWLATFAVRALAERHRLIVMPDDRRVHERPTPTAGGAAMYLGLLAAMVAASQLAAFRPVFRGNSAPFGVVVAATVIFVVGLADDMKEMSPPAKLAGQVLAGTVLYFFGVSMLFFHVPWAGTISLDPNFGALATVLWVAVMANAINFIDGLDGLAAGVVAIGAAAFVVYAYQLAVVGNITSGNAGPLVAVIAVGLCVGFLPHNFYPARIFMGDGGAMLLGLLMAAATMSVVGQDSYQSFSGRTYFFFSPIIIPFFILGIPLFDIAFAIVRRAGQGMSPAVADINHLHHRLMRLGHGHRPTVLILWAWTALLSGLVLWPGVTNSHNEIPPIAVGALAILLYTLFAPRGRGAARPNGNGRAPSAGSERQPGPAPLHSPPVEAGEHRRSVGARAGGGARPVAVRRPTSLGPASRRGPEEAAPLRRPTSLGRPGRRDPDETPPLGSRLPGP